jgi:hypothetical protein
MSPLHQHQVCSFVSFRHMKGIVRPDKSVMKFVSWDRHWQIHKLLWSYLSILMIRYNGNMSKSNLRHIQILLLSPVLIHQIEYSVVHTQWFSKQQHDSQSCGNVQMLLPALLQPQAGLRLSHSGRQLLPLQLLSPQAGSYNCMYTVATQS